MITMEMIPGGELTPGEAQEIRAMCGFDMDGEITSVIVLDRRDLFTANFLSRHKEKTCEVLDFKLEDRLAREVWTLFSGREHEVLGIGFRGKHCQLIAFFE